MLEAAARDGRAYQVVVLDNQMPEMSGLDVAPGGARQRRSCARAAW